MSIPRDAWWEKWHRAEEHRQNLADEIVQTFSDERHQARMAIEPGGQLGEYIFRVSRLYTAPVMRWALIMGDAANNLRASLDHLAWRLALIHARGAEPIRPNRIVFPIYDSADRFKRSQIREDFDSFHWSMFDEFQPYRGLAGRPDSWSGDYVHPLALLQALTNRDKHQHLTPILLPPSQYRFPGGLITDPARTQWPYWDPADFATASDPMEVGAVVMRVRMRNPALRVRTDVESSVAPSVSLPRHGPVVPALERIARFVRGILSEFDPLV